jgi:hypothetical protein
MQPSGIFQDSRRPYSGQSHTDQGERGKEEVRGLTMKDITDCVRVALWESAGSSENAETIFDVDLSEVDPIAVEQNVTCNIEKMMDIYPNIPKTESTDIPMIELDWEEEQNNTNITYRRCFKFSIIGGRQHGIYNIT